MMVRGMCILVIVVSMCFQLILIFVYPIEGDKHIPYIYGNMHVHYVDGSDHMFFIDITLNYMSNMARSSYGLGYFFIMLPNGFTFIEMEFVVRN